MTGKVTGCVDLVISLVDYVGTAGASRATNAMPLLSILRTNCGHWGLLQTFSNVNLNSPNKFLWKKKI